jgi:hypothetical protein
MMLAGCVSNPLTRAQMAEEKEKETDLSVLTVGDVTFVDNVEPIVVQGVGLVRGLAGTGHSPDGYYRKLLEQYLLKTIGTRRGEIVNDEPHITVKKLLDSPENAMVIVTGRINAGVRRGERFDIEVTLPPGSKTSSLAGGYLEVCQLRLYARKSSLNASEKFARDNTLLGSNVIAQAKGPLVVGFGNNTDAHELRRGEIWLGGLTRIDRPYAFVLRMDEKLKSIRLTNHIAENLNLLYQDDPHSKPVLNEQQKYHMQLVENMTDQLKPRRRWPRRWTRIGCTCACRSSIGTITSATCSWHARRRCRWRGRTWVATSNACKRCSSIRANRAMSLGRQSGSKRSGGTAFPF